MGVQPNKKGKTIFMLKVKGDPKLTIAHAGQRQPLNVAARTKF